MEIGISGCGALNVFGAYVLALRVVERIEAENNGNARSFIDDIIEIAELRIPHLRPGIIGSRNAVASGIGPHSHDTKIAIAIRQYCGFRIEDRSSGRREG